MTLDYKLFSCALGLFLINFLQGTSGQDYIIGDKYYRIFTMQKVNWYRAFQKCSAYGMQLASIENESDLNELKTALFAESLLGDNYWLAGNNMASRSEYIWLSNGQKISYTKWAPTQPSFSANRCIRTNFNFEWISDPCNNLNYFICAKPVVANCGVYGGCSIGLTYLYE